MHLAFRRMNASRAAGKLDEKWASMSDEQRMAAGDKRPDFVYTL